MAFRPGLPGRAQRLEDNNEQRQQGQVGKQGDQHGKPGQQPKVDRGYEAGERQDGETKHNRYGSVVHGTANAVVAALHAGPIVMVLAELQGEPVYVVDSVVYRDTDNDCDVDLDDLAAVSSGWLLDVSSTE